MLSEISWTSYFLGVVSVSVPYYLIVLVRYYLPRVLAGLKADHKRNKVEYQSIDKSSRHKGSSEDMFDNVEEVIKLSTSVVREKYRNFKEECLSSIKSVLNEYSELRDSPLKSIIEEEIKREFERLKDNGIDETEVKSIWD